MYIEPHRTTIPALAAPLSKLDEVYPPGPPHLIVMHQFQQKSILLSVAGGVNKNNVADYAKLGIRLFITSAPYYAQPEDIKVLIEKI